MAQMLVYTNAVDGRDDEFNKWYDGTHIPEVLEFAGFSAAQRFALSEAQVFDDQPFRYVAIYEFDGPADQAKQRLLAAAPKFAMSDAMAESTNVVLIEEIAPRATSSS